MKLFSSVLEMIGSTPMLELTKFDTGPCRLFAKLENQNPAGSIKDRIGLSIIDAAEREGRIKPGGTIIEATAGNTGLGLALVAAQKGYSLLLVIPDKMSPDKIAHLKAMGVEVRLTRSDVGKGHPEYYQDIAERLEREIPNSCWVDQFSNPANPLAHETGTGPEIFEQMDGRIDTIVLGVGSGGTLTGLGRYFEKVAPDMEIVLADPSGSILAETVATGQIPEDVGSWLVEGIGEDFVPSVCDLDLVTSAISVDDSETFAAERDLLSCEGILGGSSTGTLLAAALKYCRAQTTPKRVVTLVCDTGNKYLSKAFNTGWLLDHGLLERKLYGDLRDLITRRANEDEVVAVTGEDTLMTAYNRMRMFDVSQLPVMDQGSIKGLIDESDILLAIYGKEEHFQKQVVDFMVTDLEFVAPSAPIESLQSLFEADKIAIVADDTTFYGLITRVDLINHIRKTIN